jgi:MFS transporter, DHA2 family, methylenomycin A resistance protein
MQTEQTDIAADRRKWMAFATVALGYFAVQLAMTSVPPMLPTLASLFASDVSMVSWTMTAYFLTITSSLLMAGRLGDLLGYPQVFAWGVVLYSLATLACGLAQTVEQLIVLRGVQGIGGALVFGNSLAIVTNAFPASQRGRAVGALVMVSSLGAMLGTVLGTLAIQYATWRWTFYLVLPLGVVAAYLAYTLGRLNRSTVAGLTFQQKRFDVVGGALLFAMLSALSLGLSHLHAGEQSFSAGWFYHLTFITLGVYCLIAFLATERRAANPLVPLQHFGNFLFSGAVIGNWLLHMTMLGIFVLTPFFLERGLYLSTTHVAILLTTQQFYSVLTSYMAGWLHDKVQACWIRPVGMGLICLGFFSLSLMAPGLTFTTYMLISVPIGIGMGTFMSVNTTVIMSAVPTNLRGFASGMLETTRQGGHMFAVPLVSGIMTGVAGATLTADTEPALYVRGFQAACMVVGCIGLVAMACAFVPERQPEVKGNSATAGGLAIRAESPGRQPSARAI